MILVIIQENGEQGMLSIQAGQNITLEAKFKDAFGNFVAAPAEVVWSVTGPISLSNTYPSDPLKKVVTSTGAIAPATVTVTSGALTKTENVTLTAGPASTIELVVV